MASSGGINTTDYEGRYLTFSWRQVSQNISNNTTTISWSLKGAGEGQAGWYMAGNFKVVIDGTTAYSSEGRIQLYNGTVVASGTKTFTHNVDGTKQFTVSVEAGIYKTAVNCTGAGVATLNNIPQPCDFTVTDGTLGVNQTISVTRKDNAFSYGLTYSCGTVTTNPICDWTTTAGGVGFTPPLALAYQAVNGTKVWVEIHLQTYRSDGSAVGNVITKGVWMAIPDSIKPSCTVEVSDPTGYFDKFGAFIQGQSQMAIKVTPTISYGSVISSYLITADGNRFTTAEATTPVIRSTGDVEIYADVTDTRGRLGSVSTTVKVLPYTPPSITELKVHRCKADGTEDDRGSYAKVTYSYSIDTLGGKNGMSAYVQYKKTTDTQYTSVELPTKFSVDNETYMFQADDASAYDVQLLVADSLVSVSHSTTISTGFTLIHYGSSGKSITFGGINNNEGVHIMNLPFTIDGVGVADFVVEQGYNTDRGWHYRKWNSGYAECWGRFQGAVSLSKSGNGVYYSDMSTIYFPFTFASKPTVIFDGGSESHMNFIRGFGRYEDRATFTTIGLVSMSNVTIHVDIMVSGKWKE